jgi:hypothetical protein
MDLFSFGSRRLRRTDKLGVAARSGGVDPLHVLHVFAEAYVLGRAVEIDCPGGAVCSSWEEVAGLDVVRHKVRWD